MARKLLMLLFSLTTAALLSGVNCYSKRWIWSTNWNDPRNWDKGRIPCSKDEITLAQGVVYATKNATVSNLVFQTSGEFVFGDNIEISVEEASTASSTNQSCKGEPIRFIGSTPKDWFNPLNWNFLENGVKADWNDATLYMDRIPCKHDTVAFPEANAFSITLGQDAEVAEVYLNKKSFTNAELSSYMTSDQGKLRFKNSTNRKVVVNNNKCQQSTGCSCGYAKIKDFICQKFKCPATCKQKVKPVGDCCERCGALVTMNINQEFNFDLCQATLRSKIASSKAKLGISPIEENNAIEKMQILLTDKSEGEHAVKAAKYITEYLSKADKGSGCGVFNVKISTVDGGGGKTGRTTGKKKGSSTTAIALGVSLGLVLMILAIGGLYLFCHRRARFSRKQVLMNEMDLAGAHNVEMQDTGFIRDVFDFDPTMGASGLKGESFENPMYDAVMHKGPAVIEPTRDTPPLQHVISEPVKKSKKEEKKKKSNKTEKANSKVKKSESSDAFDNPVYGTMSYTPDFDDTFDSSNDKPVPGDTGFNNPLYSDMFTGGNPADIEEVHADEPPSFLDTVGFGASEFDAQIDNVSKEKPVSSKQAKVVLDDGQLDLGDSEA